MTRQRSFSSFRRLRRARHALVQNWAVWLRYWTVLLLISVLVGHWLVSGNGEGWWWSWLALLPWSWLLWIALAAALLGFKIKKYGLALCNLATVGLAAALLWQGSLPVSLYLPHFRMPHLLGRSDLSSSDATSDVATVLTLLSYPLPSQPTNGWHPIIAELAEQVAREGAEMLLLQRIPNEKMAREDLIRELATLFPRWEPTISEDLLTLTPLAILDSKTKQSTQGAGLLLRVRLNGEPIDILNVSLPSLWPPQAINWDTLRQQTEAWKMTHVDWKKAFDALSWKSNSAAMVGDFGVPDAHLLAGKLSVGFNSPATLPFLRSGQAWTKKGGSARVLPSSRALVVRVPVFQSLD